jgi:hypothetical protein
MLVEGECLKGMLNPVGEIRVVKPELLGRVAESKFW